MSGGAKTADWWIRSIEEAGQGYDWGIRCGVFSKHICFLTLRLVGFKDDCGKKAVNPSNNPVYGQTIALRASGIFKPRPDPEGFLRVLRVGNQTLVLSKGKCHIHQKSWDKTFQLPRQRVKNYLGPGVSMLRYLHFWFLLYLMRCVFLINATY